MSYTQPVPPEYCLALDGQHGTPSLTARHLSSALLVPTVLPGAPSHCSLLPAFLPRDPKHPLPSVPPTPQALPECGFPLCVSSLSMLPGTEEGSADVMGCE